jgi:alkyl sulfatase BDS1-like metallo-beta-lactamase superfamily hydrolase
LSQILAASVGGDDGANLDKSPVGQVSTGPGIATSEGSLGLMAPTTDITREQQRPARYDYMYRPPLTG